MAAQPQPLILSLPQPEADAFELYRRAIVPGRPSFLFESGKGGGETARWSFFGSDPYLELSGKDARYELRTRDGSVVHKGEPFAALAELLRASRMPRPEDAPPFIGGAVGYFGYDLIRRFEKLPNLATDDLRLPDLLFAFVDCFAALDHHTRTLHLIYAPPLDRTLGQSREKLYSEGCDRLAELQARLQATRKSGDGDLHIGHLTVKPEQSRSDYVQRASQIQEFIRSGDIYQANLSHRLTIDRDPGWPLEHFRQHAGEALYSRVREVNPSPFAGLLAFDNMTLVSSSPERLVRLDGRRVDTRTVTIEPRAAAFGADLVRAAVPRVPPDFLAGLLVVEPGGADLGHDRGVGELLLRGRRRSAGECNGYRHDGERARNGAHFLLPHVGVTLRLCDTSMTLKLL